MGGKAQVILPLIALAGLGVATGGFGLAGGAATSGAGAGGAGAAGGAAAGASATGAGLATAAPTALIPGGTAAATASGVAAGAALPAIGGATTVGFAPGVTAATIAGETASTGFFAGLANEFAALSTIDKVGLGLSGAGAAGSAVSGMANARATEAALAAQARETELLVEEDKLTVSEQELENQKRLRRVLAAQQVQSAAAGVAPSAQLADAAFAEAESGLDSLENRRALLETQGTLASDSFALRRRLAARRGTGQAVGSLLDFGATGPRVLGARF